MREYRSPLKPCRSLDQLHPGISKHPSEEYFRTRNVNDIPGRPKEQFFSSDSFGRPIKKRYGSKRK